MVIRLNRQFPDEITGLDLRPDDEDLLSGFRELLENQFHLFELLLGLEQIENVDAVLDAIDVISHLRGPVLALISDMHRTIEHILYQCI